VGTDADEIILVNALQYALDVRLRDQGTPGNERPRLTVILYPLIPAIAHGA
jgi:hypothetical protein